jgi:anti-anti-sigma regulatory factor
MNGIECRNAVTLTIEAGPNGEMSELVRGREKALLEQVKPLVRDQSVLLDLRHVERIDAAGIAALITLYCEARQADHDFAIAHATPRVNEILLLVGVQHLLANDGVEALPGRSLPLELAAV